MCRVIVSCVACLDDAMPQKPKPPYYSQRDLAAALEVQTWAIRYAIESRRIEPTIIAGGRRLFDEEALRKIKQALAEIAYKRRHSLKLQPA